MKILVIGSGGREHALAWRFAAEGAEVLVAPGNGGTPRTRQLDLTDLGAIVQLAQAERVDLTVIGPEAPLAAGVVDALCASGLKVLGPTQAAARLEWSKAFAKDFLLRQGIPTARAEVVADESAARRVIARWGLPVVLKADGLAAGKGVTVAATSAEVDTALTHLFQKRTFGSAADHVLVEECLSGPELSVLAFTDGEKALLMPPARDYKRLLDGDRGPNTGGMGGVTWPAYANRELLVHIERDVILPTLDAMREAGRPYRGILYCGLMLTADGPRVLEFNCRFGDPECQLIVPLMDGSLSELCMSIAAGDIDSQALRWKSARTFGVVLAAPGYPDAPRLGSRIRGLEAVGPDVQVFHAGTSRDPQGVIRTAGGRVLTVVGSDRDAVYRAAETMTFEGKQIRTDIGLELTAAGDAEASQAIRVGAGAGG